MSLYGFYELLLTEETKNEIVIKISVESPGFIELIVDNIDVVLIVIKVLKIIAKVIENKQINSKNDEIIINKYYKYEVDKLKLEIPVILINNEDKNVKE